MAPSRTALTRKVATAFRRRWALVAARERLLREAQTDTDRLRDLAVLMASVRAMGWDEALEREDADVWERWAVLRRRLVG